MNKRLPVKRNNEYGYFGAVVNDCFIDGAKGSPSIPFGNLGVEEIVIANDDHDRLIDLISATLTSYEQSVLALYLDGLSYSEISHELNKDIKSIDNAVQRIRRKLREKYSGVIS